MSPYARVRNAGDARQVRRAGKLERQDEAQINSDLRAVLSTLEGRRLIWHYLGKWGLMEECFTGNSNTFYREGRAGAAKELWKDINDICPEALIEMQKEALEKRLLEESSKEEPKEEVEND